MVAIPPMMSGAPTPEATPGIDHAREFVELGIDDLAKFRIIEFLYENPTVVGTCAFYADQLGLKPPEHTQALLEELVVTGLLLRRAPDGAEPCYGLSASPSLRQRLVHSFNRARGAPLYGQVLAFLAARSLHKVRARAARLRKRS